MIAMSKSFCPMRNVSLDVTLPAGRYILIPTMFKAGTTEVPYFIEMHADKLVKYEILGDALPDIDKLKVEKVAAAPAAGEGKVGRGLGSRAPRVTPARFSGRRSRRLQSRGRAPGEGRYGPRAARAAGDGELRVLGRARV